MAAQGFRERDAPLVFAFAESCHVKSVSVCVRYSEFSQDRFRCRDLFTNAYFWCGSQRQVDVNARTKTDKTVALTTRQHVAGLDVAQDAARDQTGHLHASDALAIGSGDRQRITL